MPPPPRGDLPVFQYNWHSAKKKKTMWFIGVEVEQETSAPPPKKNPGSAPGILIKDLISLAKILADFG